MGKFLALAIVMNGKNGALKQVNYIRFFFYLRDGARSLAVRKIALILYSLGKVNEHEFCIIYNK